MPRFFLSHKKSSYAFDERWQHSGTFILLVMATNRQCEHTQVAGFMPSMPLFYSLSYPIILSHTLATLSFEHSKCENFHVAYLRARDTYEWVVWTYGIMWWAPIKISLSFRELNSIFSWWYFFSHEKPSNAFSERWQHSANFVLLIVGMNHQCECIQEVGFMLGMAFFHLPSLNFF